MNIFAVHRDPVLAARALCDRHVVKMTLETAQILCTVAQACGHAAPYRPTHRNHPSVRWAGACFANWRWLVLHGLALAAEYQRRFGRTHKCLAVIEWARDAGAGPAPCTRRRQPFAQAMPDEFRGHDAVAAYRRYYCAAKAEIARWTPPARAPKWFLPPKASVRRRRPLRAR